MHPQQVSRWYQADWWGWKGNTCCLHVERKINAVWDITEESMASFPYQVKMNSNDFINILFMQTIQQHVQDMVCNTGFILRSVIWKIICYVPSLRYELLADLQWTFAAISKQATVALLSLKGHLGLLIAFQKASLLLNKIANGKEQNHMQLLSWSSP